ncbi:hypothetical protein FIBSPDRAFT_921540 [Athelia psychrophila]|uniref:Phosphomethylpyrimidine kinase n=1 Tax=Athelia psychrophila TaxID=1759441 RepID=A0A166CM73_9AGAM|nr:hypothetical protein FIBSPDRAFT_921540 [Fibularhizoctonia sp. CBS 109695]
MSPKTGPPAILTIAGSDSGGGAGIQADLKTFTALECYGTTVITALTAQNTTGVQGIHPVPPEFVKQQIESVLNDLDIRAIKTGMLFDADNTRAVASALRARYPDLESAPPLVCDPVCVSTSGHTLLQPEAVEVLINEIFPLTSLVTPNKSEAELLLSHRDFPCKIENVEDMLTAAGNLSTFVPKSILLKGGHLKTSMSEIQLVSLRHPNLSIVGDGMFGENMEILKAAEGPISEKELVVDLLYESADKITMIIQPRIQSTSTHGTGCTLSAAIACGLGAGMTVVQAVQRAAKYTHLGIETAVPIGGGCGPLNHLHGISPRIVPSRTSSNPNPLTRSLIQATSKTWKEYVQHDFVVQLGRGTLAKQSFVHFIKQDYHYLKYYARAHGLLAAKSPSYASNESAAQIILDIAKESRTHTSFCADWDVSRDELEATPESLATMAYGSYLIDVGLQGDTAKLVMAVSACLFGYGEVGLWLKKEAAKPNSWVVIEGNPYQKWIEDYSGPLYQAAVTKGIATIEAMAEADPPSETRLAEWQAVWEKCTWLEKNFWDMAMNLS